MPGPDKKMPCKNCPDRRAGERETDCHTDCEAYRKYREEIQKAHVFLMKENNTGHMFPPTVKYHKSSGHYRAPKGITHKKER